ncbi:MAG: cation transporter [Edaphobacter sp.]|nr:cation transporter [Edaphobacter sp.]
MASRASKKIIYAAVVSNVAIALCKYVAAAFTGSSSMLAEAFHSTVDTGNEILLLVGLKRSERPPSALHPFGHGKALYFYSLLVAVYTFGIGGGLAVYHGISVLRHSEPVIHSSWNYAVLAFSAAFDFYSWRISYLELRAQKKRGESLWDEVVGSKDPAIFTVFLEDSASLIGILVAFCGILLGQICNRPYFDPAASILIGILLFGTAVLLGRESGALLVGERTRSATIRKVKRILRDEPSVEEVGDLLTMQLGPEQVLLTADVRFQRELDVEHLEKAISNIESRIRSEEPRISQIFLQPNPLDSRSKSA